jgi:hypothetical protein
MSIFFYADLDQVRVADGNDDAPSDIGDFRSPADLSARMLPELTAMTDGHAATMTRQPPSRQASILRRLPREHLETVCLKKERPEP